jgi:hypothetical protein
MSIKCWEPEHVKWSFGLGLPFIFLWVIGFPVIGFITLYKNRFKLEDPYMIGRYRIIY